MTRKRPTSRGDPTRAAIVAALEPSPYVRHTAESIGEAADAARAWLASPDADPMLAPARGTDRPTIGHLAAAIGDADLLRTWIGRGGVVDAADGIGRTPLHHAVMGHGDDIHAKMGYGDESPRACACVAILVDAGADLHVARPAGGTPMRPLDDALDHGMVGVVHRLLAAGADPLRTDPGPLPWIGAGAWAGRLGVHRSHDPRDPTWAVAHAWCATAAGDDPSALPAACRAAIATPAGMALAMRLAAGAGGAAPMRWLAFIGALGTTP